MPELARSAHFHRRHKPTSPHSLVASRCRIVTCFLSSRDLKVENIYISSIVIIGPYFSLFSDPIGTSTELCRKQELHRKSRVHFDDDDDDKDK